MRYRVRGAAIMPISNTSAPSRLCAAPLWVGQAVLFLSVGIACLAGIHSRPVGYLAAFWPANAIMLGLLLRYPHWVAAWTTWLYGLLAYVLADLATGAAWPLALGLNVANVAGVLAGWLYFSRLAPSILHLLHLRSILHLLAGCTIAALGCMVLGAPIGHAFFHMPPLQAMAMWVSSEFASYILIIPLFLAVPQGTAWHWPWRPRDWTHALPLLALVGSEMLAFVLGGPGYLGISMPAMVWCAMAYGVFPVAVLNLLACTWKTASIAMGVFSFTPEHIWDVMSLRLGMALLSLAPLAVASAYALRLQALERLNYVLTSSPP